MIRVCRIPSDPEEATSADYPYQALELGSHEVSQKAAGLILLCLTLSVAKNGEIWGSCAEVTREGNPQFAFCWVGYPQLGAASLGIMPCMHSLLFLLVSSGAVFCLQDQVEEHSDACPACSAPLAWLLGVWSPHGAPAQGAEELQGLLWCELEQGMALSQTVESSGTRLL